MVAQLFRTTRSLTEYQKSDPVEFVVLLDADKTFIRVIAQYADNVVLGGLAPTILIQAGIGQNPTAVDEGAGPVTIPGSNGRAVATATCERRIAEDNDTFLITIDHTAPAGPWQFLIQNNEPNALTFNGFISHTESETRLPWLDPGDTPALRGELRLGAPVRTTAGILVRNLGAVPLKIEGRVGDRLGGEDSPVRILSMPETPIRPHHTDTISVECAPLKWVDSPRIDTYEHLLKTNDPFHERTIVLRLWRHIEHPERCRVCSYCLEFEQGQIPEPWELPPDSDMTPDDFLGLCYCAHYDKVHGLYPPGWRSQTRVLTSETAAHRVKWSETIEKADTLARERAKAEAQAIAERS